MSNATSARIARIKRLSGGQGPPITMEPKS